MAHVLIVGAGPAGASLAHLLAHRGVDVTLLERRRDFEREFRGEVLMPSGVEALEQMGLAQPLTAVPTQLLQWHRRLHGPARHLAPQRKRRERGFSSRTGSASNGSAH